MAPYKNPAQKRYFEYLESQGKLPKKMAEEENLEDAAPGYAEGGFVEEDNFDYDLGHSRTPVSSGEPRTEFEFEDDHPMEFMNKGGRVKNMGNGGAVRDPGFVKALRKSY